MIGIQANILQLGAVKALHFTTVIDTYEEPEEEYTVADPPTDRTYWEQRATKETVALVDRLLELIHTFEPTASLNYHKFYIGLTVGNRSNNFAMFTPQKSVIRLEVKFPQTEETDDLLTKSGLDLGTYDRQYHRYRISLARDDMDDKARTEVITKLIKQAWNKWMA